MNHDIKGHIRFLKTVDINSFLASDNPLKMVLASPTDRKCQRYPLVLKLNVTWARPLRLVILYFLKWKILSDDRRLYLHDSKWNSGSDVDGLTHTKQLLNLLCIVYKLFIILEALFDLICPSQQFNLSTRRCFLWILNFSFKVSIVISCYLLQISGYLQNWPLLS